MAADRGARAGGALAVAVFTLLALTLLAHGALLLTRHEAAASSAALRVVQARVAAEAAVSAALASARVRIDSLPGGSLVPVLAASRDGVEYRAFVRRIGVETALVEGVGRSAGAPWGAPVARLAWALDPLTRVAAFSGTVDSGVDVGAPLGASVDGWARDWDDPARAECAPWREALDSVLGVPEPAVSRVTADPVAEPALGLLRVDRLTALLPAVPGAVGTPRPVSTLGRCDPLAPWSWGDPEPGTPCHAHRVALVSDGPLRLVGGVGQGLLVVTGRLELEGTGFDGLVLVGDTLVLGDGAVIRGLVRAAGGLRVDPGAGIVRGGCSAALALDGARTALGGLVPVRAGWVGPLGRLP